MLDHYAYCPCGSGKKIKFCCSNDLLSEMDRVARLVDSKQLNAAVDQLNNLMSFKGRRPALLATKCQIQMASGDMDGANLTVSEWLQRDPRNLAALAAASSVCTMRGDLAGAIERFSRAFEYAETFDAAAVSLLHAIRLIARLMAENQDTFGTLAYASLAATYERLMETPEEQAIASDMVRAVQQSPKIPPIAKQLFSPRKCPETVVWRDDFQAAFNLITKGAIWKACEAFEALASRFPSQPSILWNLAVLRLQLGNPHISSLAWRAFAALPTVPADEAIEALMIAEFIEPRNPDMVDYLTQEFPLTETDRVTERMLSDRRFISVRDEIEEWEAEDGPPPKAAFIVCDRVARDIAVPRTMDEVPVVLGRIYVFGRQTDRAARIELSTHDSDQLPVILLATLRDVCGEALGAAEPAKTYAKLPLLSVLRSPSFLGVAPTADDPEGQAIDQSLFPREKVRRNLLDVWTSTPLKALDGKTPRDAANDSTLRVRLTAIIGLAEQESASDEQSQLFDEVRERIGLSPEPRFSGPELDLESIPLYRFRRVDVDSLDDKTLCELLFKASRYSINDVKQSAATAVLARPSLQGNTARLVAVDAMIKASKSMAEASQRFDEAIALCKQLKLSHASFLLQKLNLLLMTGQGESAKSLINEIQRDFSGDNAVINGLLSIIKPFMRRMPDGRLSVQLPSFAAPGSAPSGAVPASKPSGLWTPDQGPPLAGAPITAGTPTAPGGASKAVPTASPAAAPAKSKLWIPGMD
ncbi:MAG: hypothetical protein ACKO38_12450 [Planctomycetota bacterium]